MRIIVHVIDSSSFIRIASNIYRSFYSCINDEDGIVSSVVHFTNSDQISGKDWFFLPKQNVYPMNFIVTINYSVIENVCLNTSRYLY